jgi:hypothetical protein
MTIERRIIAGLEDVKYIVFQCNECAFRISMSPDDIRQIPENCLGGHKWEVGQQEAKVLSPLRSFTTSFQQLRILIGQKSFGFRILLEFEEPKGSQ